MTIATRGQSISGENLDAQGPSPGPSSTADTTSDELQDDTLEPEFPHDKLVSLDEKISNLRWVVPVLADQELECLLKVSIDLAKKNQDTRSEACQRFFREGLTISFTKILTDDAVSSWKPNIHACINQNCLKLIELCVVKLPHDWFPLLDLLAMVLNPNNKFHTFNSSRQSETAGPNCNLTEEELFARSSSDPRNPRGWLVDLINRFGELGGFQLLLDRFQSGKNLCVSIVFALLRPFGLCYEFLTPHTINKYILPILAVIVDITFNEHDRNHGDCRNKMTWGWRKLQQQVFVDADTATSKVPTKFVGQIIGRGDSKMNYLQYKSGAGIQVTKDRR